MIKYYSELFNLERATEGASGYDLRANFGHEEMERIVECGQRWKIRTGIYLEMPIGVEAQVRSRSGMAINHGVIVLNAPGTVDSDYRGEICVSLINHDKNQAYKIRQGDRIAQLVFAPVFVYPQAHPGWDCDWTPQRVTDQKSLGRTTRGESGHGSTGR